MLERTQVWTLAERVQEVESCREDAGLAVDGLWMRCIALGQLNGPMELEAILYGALRPTRQEFNLIAVALNEYLIEADLYVSISYIEDEEPGA